MAHDKVDWYKGLSVASANALLLAGFKSKEEVKEASYNQPYNLLKIPNIGKTRFKEICEWCDGLNYSKNLKLLAAITLLEGYGYKITEPPTEEPS